MTDFLPMLIWMLAPMVGALRGLRRATFVAAVGVSVLIQTIGAFWYTGALDAAILEVGMDPDRCAVPGTGATRHSLRFRGKALRPRS